MKISMNIKTEPFSEEVSLKYFRDVVLGLEFLHSQRIIHCDLKPENILLTNDDHAQISDFGISHMCDTSYDDLMGLKQGSPPFTPPEACDHHANTINGKALDIWCLGVTLFCFLHGRLPFEVSDGNILELFQLILHSEPVYFAISDSAKALLTRMLKKYAYQRIKLSQIKTHDWVTLNGDWPMLSKEENCTVIELTPEEVENAVTSMGTFTRFIHRVKKAASFRSKSPNGDSDSKRDTSSLSRCSSPGISQDYLDSGFNINKSSRK